MRLSARHGTAALMDGIYGRQRFIYDWTRRFFLLGRDRLIAELDPGTGAVLEIGCGTGRNLIAIARRYPAATLYGVDVSVAMLTTARAAIGRRELGPRIRVAQADATVLDTPACLGVAAFDRIVFSYTLCMIPNWEAALRQALARLGPDGQLHIVDFGAWRGAPGWLRGALAAWLARFHVSPMTALPDALIRVAPLEDWRQRTVELGGGYAILAVVTRL